MFRIFRQENKKWVENVENIRHQKLEKIKKDWIMMHKGDKSMYNDEYFRGVLEKLGISSSQ